MSRTRVPAADHAARARKVLDARMRGATWDVAASEAGFANAQNARRSVKSYLGKLPEPDLVEMRDDATRVMMFARGKAIEAVEAGKPGALRDLVSVEGRTAALLGLDAPSGVVMYTPTTTELEQWVDYMTKRVTPALSLVEADVIDIDDEVIEA